ncbi:MAG: glycolate oxidase subunit GlcE [Phenylobacterium sp.]
MPNSSASEALADQVRAAARERRPLRIVGGDSKAFLGRPVGGETLSLREQAGVVDYDPAELVVTARAGTPVLELQALLAGRGQMLGFEPPVFGQASTIGGVVAAGLSGPRRPFAGAVRDAVLGVGILDGRGRALRFGGVVFKNVAGFDAFRLMAGAFGRLGVILEVSLRVAPRPAAEVGLALEVALEQAREVTGRLLRQAAPLSGACHDGARLHLRLSGGRGAVAAAARQLGGEAEDLGFWTALRDLALPVFGGDGRLWRLGLPEGAATPDLPGGWVWDWAGAQRWLVSDAPAADVRAAAASLGGHATLFRGQVEDGEAFSPLAGPVLALHKRLAAVFDPAGILNPGRLHAEL